MYSFLYANYTSVKCFVVVFKENVENYSIAKIQKQQKLNSLYLD